MTAPRDNSRDLDRISAAKVANLAASLGRDVREERVRRGLSTWELACAAGVSQSVVSGIENGRVASLATYTRLATALRLDPAFALATARRRGTRADDPVHAAMCEILAGQLRGAHLHVTLDEPYQHYQFAGRGDVVGRDEARRALFHAECRTQFPNLQEAIGAFAAKKAYLGGCLADREGRQPWQAETHAIVALWSAEVLHALRLHAESFRATCPDRADGFEAVWRGEPLPGRHHTLVVFDPVEAGRSDRRRWVGLEEALRSTLKPRYRDYADAVEALKGANLT